MTAAPAPPASSYDAVPYDSFAYPQSHPSRLFVVATLFGLRPPSVDKCRVLELGCAAGGNLIPMAEQHPGSEFVGVDLSARQIAQGEAIVADLGLTNCTLKHASITDVDESYGTFDYVIAHGVFSWVPTEVQEAMYALLGRQLSPGGVAYVSYNTYPGWHMRGMIRDVMRYHAHRFPDPAKRVEQARAVLDFLAAVTQTDGQVKGTAWGVLLKDELDLLRKMPDHYLYHDHLEDVNAPVYFHQFVDRAKAHGLRYLGESRVNTMVPANFGPDVERTLRTLGSDVVETEQFMDFIRSRTFRESLLVRDLNPVRYQIEPERVWNLHVASNGKPADPGDPDYATGNPERFKSARGVILSTDRPLLKAAMRVLSEAWPGTVAFDDLRQQARARVEAAGGPLPAEPEDGRVLAVGLMNCFLGSDMVELYAAPLTFARAPGVRPTASPFARRRVADMAVVSNRRHEPVRVSAFGEKLLPLLDGTRDRGGILDGLTALALTGELRVEKDGAPLYDPADVRATLAGELEKELQLLADRCLLVG